MQNDVRVRFAPSPTGSPHIGSMRTAVFDWLYARHTGGKFLLRIEDTDRTRLVPGALEQIMHDLRWLGLQWDEGPDVGGPYGPYLQSERLEMYQRFAQKLIEEGKAYHCYCSSGRLAEMRQQQEARKEAIGYDRRCRDLTPEEDANCRAENPTPVVRFKMPLTGTTSFTDVVRGEIVFDNSLQDDFVIVKSDGFPTYHFALVVDDHHMRISHAIRGEEWISSTPRHIQLYQALGWDPPHFVHPPVIVGTDRKKLSKRHGDVTFGSYIEAGYLPEAILNFLTLMGWSAGEDRDLYSRDELIEKFTLEGIVNHPAVFDTEKFQWMNGQYIRLCDFGRLVDLTLPYLQRAGLVPESPTVEERAYAEQVVSLIQERMTVLSDAPGLCDFFFLDEPSYDPKAEAKWLSRPQSADLLNNVAGALGSLQDWSPETIENTVRASGAELGLEGGSVIHPIRVGVTGRTVGPGLFETIEVLGKERTVARLRKAAEIAAQQIPSPLAGEGQGEGDKK